MCSPIKFTRPGDLANASGSRPYAFTNASRTVAYRARVCVSSDAASYISSNELTTRTSSSVPMLAVSRARLRRHAARRARSAPTRPSRAVPFSFLRLPRRLFFTHSTTRYRHQAHTRVQPRPSRRAENPASPSSNADRRPRRGRNE